MTSHRTLLVASLLSLSACGPAVNRDLTEMPQRRITYDDLCHLQTYFDQRATSHAHPFRVVQEQSTETSRREADEHGTMRPVVLGEGTYLIETRSDRERLAQLLREEYHRLPPLPVAAADVRVQLRIGWWQSGTIRRIRPDVDVDLVVRGEHHELPAHPCVGEFLFGDDAYTMRRNVMAAESARSHGEIPAAYVHNDPPAQ